MLTCRMQESSADDNDNKRLRRSERLSQVDDSEPEPEPMDTSSPSTDSSTVDESPYDQDEVVAELLSFYEFLLGIHLSDNALMRPPPGGWPNISQEDLDFLEKDDVVISLLRHIPYIRQDTENDGPQVYEDTMCNDFRGKYFEYAAIRFQDREFSELMDVFEDEGNEDLFAPYTATLFRQESGQHGWYLFLNTQDGTVTMWGLGADTRFYHTLKECFEDLKDQFRNFEVYADGSETVRNGKSRWNPLDSGIREIYRTHGLFTPNYQKEQCLAAIKTHCDDLWMARTQRQQSDVDNNDNDDGGNDDDLMLNADIFIT